MKFIFTFLIIIIFSPVMANKKVHSTVDKRVEMLSIIFRLAENPEYNMKFAKNYVNDIHNHFDEYKNHGVIKFAKQLSQEKNMGFSKVMFLAVHLQFVSNRFILLKESESNLKGKWDEADAIKFVGLLNDFYHKSEFEVFFKMHKATYDRATKEFDKSVTEFDQKWYLDYYGDHDVEYQVVLGLGDGGANYGPSVTPVGKKRIVYAIMGSWTFDEAGNPLFPKDTYLTYLIHEFNHSFVDHILEENLIIDMSLQPSGERLLENKKNEMKLEGYEDWHSLINESLVRASVIRYMIDHKESPEAVEQEILNQEKKGFVWMRKLVALVGEYKRSRTKFPSFKTFYPRITDFFNTVEI